MRNVLSSKEIPNAVLLEMISCIATGSSYTCNPPVNDTDRDFVLLVEDVSKVKSALLADGFVDCLDVGTDPCTLPANSEHSPRFIARKGELNLIIVDDEEAFNIWKISTTLAKRFNLLDKVDRVDLFTAIRDRFLASEAT